ncbi:MAG: hypothetical protein ED559_06995 [Phycisphaera sp.]|nr:MAG: hypothetical protein ED559_06995 [Phycisphaera sp.]
MRFELIDQLAKPTAGCAGDLDLLECSQSRDPVIAISDQHGLSRLNSLGIEPVATLAPSTVLGWQTRHTLDRIFKRSGATSVVCRSDWSLNLAAQLSGVSPARPKDLPETRPHTHDRARVREGLGLTDADRLVVPLSNHPGEIDAMVLALFSASMAIAEKPVVVLLPAKAAFFRRARAFLSNADRVLSVIATNVPATAFAPGADAIIWGPHTSDADADYNAPRNISWARRFGVPVLCTENHISESACDDLPGKLHACAGTSAADIASPLLDIFNGSAQ